MFTLWLYTAIVTFSFTIIFILIHIFSYLFFRIKSYVDDESSLFRQYKKTSVFKTFQYVPSVNHIKIYDGEDYGVILILTFIWGLFLSAGWPLSFTFLLGYSVLRIIRWINRIRKKVKTISEYTHEHDKSVEHKKVELLKVKF